MRRGLSGQFERLPAGLIRRAAFCRTVGRRSNANQPDGVPIRGDLGQLLAWATVALAGIIIAMHAVLILAGHWDGDEFFNFAHYRQSGLSFLYFRILTWSPRPVSELALYVYARAVNAAHAPLITPFLALLWAILLASPVAAVSQGRVFSSHRLALALCLVAMFLLSHHISGMFLWPMSAAAYLLALAGLVLAVFQLVEGRVAARRGRIIFATTLSLAVLSSETGVFFTVGFAALLLVLELPRFRSGGIRRLAQAWWYLVPLALSLAVLGCALRFRVGDATSGVAPTNHYFHHLFLSLGATLYVLPKQIAVGAMAMTPRNLLMSSTIDGLFLAGVFGVYRAHPQAVPDWRHLLAATAGLLSVMVLLVLASYYQYGGWGFERHQTFFHCTLVLLLVVLASGAAAALPRRPPIARILGPVCLLAALAIGFAPRLPQLLDDYARIPQVRAARDETWASGTGPGSAMRYVLPPPGPVIGTSAWQTGTFTATSSAPWYVPGVLAFFGKHRVTIVASRPSKPVR